MKKVTFTICSLLFFFGISVAQSCGTDGPNACTPLGGPASGGFESNDSIDCVVNNVAYDYSLQFTMFTVFNYLGTQQVDSIEFVKIDSLPCGLCWSVNKTTRRYRANEDGCIRFTGTTNSTPGQYKLALSLKAWINNQPTGLPVNANLVNDAGIKMYLRVKDAGGNCSAVDTSANANNQSASLGCISGVSEITGTVSNLNIVPNPASSYATVLFTADKAAQYTLAVTDITGKVVINRSIEVKAGSNSVVIERNSLPAGMYFVSLRDGVSAVTRRLSFTE